MLVAVFSTGLVYQTTAGDTPAVTMINVGQGDAILLQDGVGFDVLIDGGKTSAGAKVLDYLRQENITELDVVAATHADSDHIGGLISVLEADDIIVKRLLFNGYPGTTNTWDDFVLAAAADKLTLEAINFPSELEWGTMHVQVLNPSSGLQNPDTNDASLVLKVNVGQIDYLFTGDITAQVETTIIAKQTPVAVDILKVAHHGSAYATSASFLDAVKPAEGIISVGSNSYGHPSPDTLARLNATNADIWRTDHSGNIRIESNGMTYTLIPQYLETFMPYVVSSGINAP